MVQKYLNYVNITNFHIAYFLINIQRVGLGKIGIVLFPLILHLPLLLLTTQYIVSSFPTNFSTSAYRYNRFFATFVYSNSKY